MSGCWGAIIRAGEYSCTIETWDNEYTVKIEHLSSLELSDENCELMQKFLSRLRRLSLLPNKDAVIDNLLLFFGKQPLPYVSEIQEELLATMEKRFFTIEEEPNCFIADYAQIENLNVNAVFP